MAQGSIVILEDEAENLKSLSRALEKVGYEVHAFQNPQEGMTYLRVHGPADLVLTDLRMPKLDGMEVLKQVKELEPSTAVVLITAFGSVESAVQAMKVGADDYLAKPVDLYELRRRVQALVEKRRLRFEVDELKARLDERFGFEKIVGRSQAMLELFQQVRMVAPTRATVLIWGESGTGKELIANAIHQNSERKRKRFLPLNCAAIPANLMESELFGHEKGAFTGADRVHMGKFEQAHGGTLFLDEIGELSLDLQVKLLRVLEERAVTRVGGSLPIPVDVRIITASHRDLNQMVVDGRFRDDLLYRLKVVELRIPPLRERTDDIPLLVHAFLAQLNVEHAKRIRGISDDALRSLTSYHWPGNVRELKNVIERMVIFCDEEELQARHLPYDFKAGHSPVMPVPQAAASIPAPLALDGDGLLAGPLDEVEKKAILKALEETGGNKTQAARVLGIGLRTLHRKLKQYENGHSSERSTP